LSNNQIINFYKKQKSKKNKSNTTKIMKEFGNLNAKYSIRVDIYIDSTEFIIDTSQVFDTIESLLFENAIHSQNLTVDEKIDIIKNLNKEGQRYIVPNPIETLGKYHSYLNNYLQLQKQNIPQYIKDFTKEEKKEFTSALKSLKIIITLCNFIKQQKYADLSLMYRLNISPYLHIYSKHFPNELKELKNYLGDYGTPENVNYNNVDELLVILNDLKDKFSLLSKLKNYENAIDIMNTSWSHLDNNIGYLNNNNFPFLNLETSNFIIEDVDLNKHYNDYYNFLQNYRVDYIHGFTGYFDSTEIMKVKMNIVNTREDIRFQDDVCKLGSDYVKEEYLKSSVILHVTLVSELSVKKEEICVGLIYCNKELRREFFISTNNTIERATNIDKYLFISTVCSNPLTEKMYGRVGVRLIEFVKKLSQLLGYNGVTLESVNQCKNREVEYDLCTEFVQDYYLKRGFEFDPYREIMKDLYFYKQLKSKTDDQNTPSNIPTNSPVLVVEEDYLKLIYSEFNNSKVYNGLVYEKDVTDKKWKLKDKIQPIDDTETIINEKINDTTSVTNLVGHVDSYDEIDPIKSNESYDIMLIPMIYHNQITISNGISSFGKFRNDYCLTKKKYSNRKHLIHHKYYNAMKKIYVKT
jgi:hypothetical protein